MDYRIGFGYDIHRFSSEGKDFLLGGVRIDTEKKIVAHSDGDVLLHSLSNALLSSVGEEDIGHFFPDDLKKTEDMNSENILLFCLDEVRKKGYTLSNVVLDVLAEKPKLSPYRERIKEHLASLLSLSLDRISLSFNTGEKVGVIGKEEAVIVYSQLLIEKK